MGRSGHKKQAERGNTPDLREQTWLEAAAERTDLAKSFCTIFHVLDNRSQTDAGFWLSRLL